MNRTFVYDWLRKMYVSLMVSIPFLFNVVVVIVMYTETQWHFAMYMPGLVWHVPVVRPHYYYYFTTSIYIYNVLAVCKYCSLSWMNGKKRMERKKWNEWMVCLTFITNMKYRHVLHDLCGKWTGPQMDDFLVVFI